MSHLKAIDALLLLMALIWGTNYSIVKSAFREIDPQAFNAVRMTIGSCVFLGLIVGIRRLRLAQAGEPPRDGAGSIASIFHTPAPLTRRDWISLAGLGVIGHFTYQYLFIGGLARTSVANSSLTLAATPVAIAFLTAALGQERVSRVHWAGAALSMLGIYIIVGRDVALGEDALTGDLMMLGAVCCWAIYTIGGRQLMTRHSSVGVTGLSMAIGTLIYVPVMSGRVRDVDWAGLSAGTWLALVYSALFALVVAYTIWYASVRLIGSARTSVYSNVVPLVAMATAVAFLGEPLGASKIVGACAVLVGVALTRIPGGGS
ncbi:MAG TPA: DMT family transporter [Vicinamibacterales bacterium]|nr:DMT family transporter [Vicinamibacterales bacterium]